MATIWEKTIRGKQYEIRGAGQTRRLYTDGVFHSQFNPRRSLTGNVWDLISLPSFFMEESRIRSVLVLGVGGGAVIQQLRRWYPGCFITGVELDATHIYLAERFFKLRGANINLVEADAVDWVAKYRGLPFDIIIDDLFGENEGEPERVIEGNKAWVSKISRILAPNGMVVMNFVAGRDLRNSVFLQDVSFQKKYSQVFRFMTPLYENNIGVFLQEKCSINEWRRRIMAKDSLSKEFCEYQSKYQIRKLLG